MSVRATTWVWDQSMPPSEKLVLLRLADHASPDGGDVYPSVASVALHTGISERQVQRYIKSFVERGILVITGHAKGGRSNPREYRFTFEFTSKKGDAGDTVSDRETVTQMTPIETSKGDTHDTVSERVTSVKGDTDGTERVTPMTRKGDTAMSPEPSRTVKEPSDTSDRSTQSKKVQREFTDDERLVDVWAQECNGGTWPIEAGTARKHAKKLTRGGFDEQETRELIAWCRTLDWRTSGITLGFLASQADNFRSAKREGKTVRRQADSKGGLVFG